VKFRLTALAVILLNASNAQASIFDLESLTPIRSNAKYTYALNSAKNAALKQSGISDLYKNKARQLAAEYRKETLDLIENATGLEPQTVVGVASFTAATLMNNSINLSFKDSYSVNYAISIRKESVFTSFKIDF
jgi:hypothetical protein